MKRLSVFLCAMALVFGLVGTANSALIDRGGGLIYDSDQDLTWLQNANTPGGWMHWDQAMSWAENLEYYDSVRDTTWTDWRLPKYLNEDGSYSWELFYLYAHYEISYPAQSPFYNIQPGRYWTATENLVVTTDAWTCNFVDGDHHSEGKDGRNYVLAVMDGDVAAVPIPSAVWLLGSGLIGVVGYRKLRNG